MNDIKKTNLNKFIKENKPKKPIYEHREELIELRNLGYTLEQLRLYIFKFYQIKTTVKTISKMFNDIAEEVKSSSVTKDTADTTVVSNKIKRDFFTTNKQ